MSSTPHDDFARRIIAAMQTDSRFIGLLAAGSIAQGNVDQYSDFDLVLVVEDEHYQSTMLARRTFAESLGRLLYAFTGEHVGEPRLLICLYADPLIHVDLKFVTLDDLDHRVDEPMVLWHRDDRIHLRLPLTIPQWPTRDPEWFEERFWVWAHYTATKLGRGEIFETHAALAQIRLLVLGPMVARRIGEEQRGVRRLEMLSPEISEKLAATVCDYSASRCAAALRHTIALYRDLRADSLPPNQNMGSEKVVVEFVDRVIAEVESSSN
jgi:hypothetical protein